jgi:hypothetical protein
MKPSIYRRIRRRAASHEAANVKKENRQEQPFFGEAAAEHFFQPAVAVQRKCADCEKEEQQVQKKEGKVEDEQLHRMPEKKEEEKVMKKDEEKDEKLQRSPEKKEEEKVMKKEEEKEEQLQKKETGSANTAPVTSSFIHSLNGKGAALPNTAQTFFSSRMGYDFSHVKIHAEKEANRSAREVNARAYTVGNNIVFNEGQYNIESTDGKKLMAHELTHVMQQQGDAAISKKGEEVAEPECTAGSVDLEADTAATYKKGAGTAKNEVTKKSKDCDGCEDDSCISVTGSLNVPYSVATKVNLPVVPSNLTECQQDRVRTAINTTLNAHEQQHVKAFETFNGTASLPINYQGCSDGYVSYQEGLADTEYERRKTAADAKSAALDPFSVPVDLCCKDKPKK